MAAKPIPDEFHSITPYLVVKGAARLIDFLKQAFGAEERERMAMPDGTIMHAAVKIGNSMLMMGEACDEHPAMPTMLYLYVGNTDATYHRALGAGATSIMEPADQFYGDRSAAVKGTSGNSWYIATHQEDVGREELQRRATAAREARKGAA